MSTTVVTTNWLNISWGMPVGAPNPNYFEILAFPGTDPTNQSNWITTPMQTHDGTARNISISLGSSTSISNLNVAVRAVWS